MYKCTTCHLLKLTVGVSEWGGKVFNLFRNRVDPGVRNPTRGRVLGEVREYFYENSSKWGKEKVPVQT